MSRYPAPGDDTLRASHEDRDEVVEQLRVAAGDGRLTAEELDERLGSALEARTYGELAVLVRDLPAVPAAGTLAVAAPHVVADAKDLVRLQARHGNLQRVGAWTLPGRLDLEVRGGNVLLDLTHAVITRPVLDLTVAVRSGNVRLIVPPDVAVEIDSVEVRGGNVRQRAFPEPGTPIRLLVRVSGTVRSGNVTVQGPRRGFWDRLFRRHAEGQKTPVVA